MCYRPKTKGHSPRNRAPNTQNTQTVAYIFYFLKYANFSHSESLEGVDSSCTTAENMVEEFLQPKTALLLR